MKRETVEDLKLLQKVARRLRSSRPLDFSSRLWLADHIDPNGNSERCLRFANRRRGNTGDAARDDKIAEYVWNAGGKVEGEVEAAITEAMKKFGLRRARVYAIWSEWKPILKRRYRIYGPLTHENIDKYWPR
jgi:hypothetical protein